MQGIIASLLALMMTGMVIGQQPQNSFQPGQAGNQKLLGRYLLIVDGSVVQTLRVHGYRTADISPTDRENVDHIVFHSSDNNAERQDIEPFSIQPVPPVDGERTIVFELNDHYLNLLQRKGLRYILRPQDIGRFDQLTIKYDAPTGQQAQQNTGTLPLTRRPRQAAADRTVNPLGRRLTRNSTSIENDRYFGPQLPDDWQGRQNQPQRNQSLAGNQRPGQTTQQPRQIAQQPLQTRQPNRQSTVDSGSFRPRLGTIATRRNDMRDQQNQRRDVYPNDDRGDRLLDTRLPRNQQNQQAYGDQRLNQRLDRQNLDLSNERIASNTPFDNGTFRPDSQLPRVDVRQPVAQQPIVQDYNPVLKKELDLRDAENRSLDRMNQDLADEVNSLRRRLQNEQIANRRDRFSTPDRRDPRAAAYDRDYDYVYTGRDSVRQRGYNDQVIVQPPINTGQTMPDRVAVAPRPTNRLMPFSIEGPANNNVPSQQAGTQTNAPATPAVLADTERYKKQNAALWFIMLCSVGLNFYLSWIARGFYVRYEELADDIRETFTSSM